jgi:hypothetical protein
VRSKTLHRLSGSLIALFVVTHLANHLASLWGPEEHLRLMDALRPYYRHVLAETVLLAVIGIQLYSGIRLVLRKRKTATGFFEKLHVRTGLYLAFFFVIHLSAIMAGRHLLHLDTNLYFGAVGLNRFPLNLFFVPYYSLAILAFFGHLSAIHAQKMTTNLLGLPPGKQALAILALGFVTTFLILYGLTGYFRGLEIP